MSTFSEMSGARLRLILMTLCGAPLNEAKSFLERMPRSWSLRAEEMPLFLTKSESER